MAEYFNIIHHDTDDTNSIALLANWKAGGVEDDTLKAYVLHSQKVEQDNIKASTLWFLPTAKGYRTACDYLISERQLIWGDDAP